jgi:hypothetical protein
MTRFALKNKVIPEGFVSGYPDRIIHTFLIGEETVNLIEKILKEKNDKKNYYGMIAMCESFELFDN